MYLDDRARVLSKPKCPKSGKKGDKMRVMASLMILVIALSGCAVMQKVEVPPKQQAIMYRDMLNSALSQFNHYLLTLPEDKRQEWKDKAIPVLNSMVSALGLLELAVAQNQPLPDPTEFLKQKDAFIDITAQLILSLKK